MKNITYDYDKEADVMYVSFQRPQQATDTEMVDENILIRKLNNNRGASGFLRRKKGIKKL